MRCKIRGCEEEKDLVKVLVDVDPTLCPSGDSRMTVHLCPEHRVQLEQGKLDRYSMECVLTLPNSVEEGKIKKGGVADPPTTPKPDAPPKAQKGARPISEELDEFLKKKPVLKAGIVRKSFVDFVFAVNMTVNINVEDLLDRIALEGKEKSAQHLGMCLFEAINPILHGVLQEDS